MRDNKAPEWVARYTGGTASRGNLGWGSDSAKRGPMINDNAAVETKKEHRQTRELRGCCKAASGWWHVALGGPARDK